MKERHVCKYDANCLKISVFDFPVGIFYLGIFSHNYLKFIDDLVLDGSLGKERVREKEIYREK